jgi:hypothetical protein
MAETLMVEEVLHRMQQLTGDLKLIRAEICQHVFPAEEPNGSNLFSKGHSSVEVMAQFKAAIDDVRHVVWLYLEAVGNRPTIDADSQRRLLARAMEIVTALSARPPLPQPRSNGGERSLLERLLTLIENRSDLKPQGNGTTYSKRIDIEHQDYAVRKAHQ